MRFTSFRRLGTASLAAAACVLAAPAASLASNADIGPGAVLRYTGTPTEANHLEISFDWMRGYVLSDTAVTSIALGPAAQRSHCIVSGTQVTCPWGSIYTIDVQLGGGATAYARSSLDLTPVTLRAGAGADTLIGGTMLIGGPGTDTLTAGSSGAQLVAGTGNTTMNGGSRTDTFQGGAGNDTIDAHDGIAEQVSCGAGTDTVTADPADAVAADCESVDRGAPAAPPPSADAIATGGQPTASDPGPVASAPISPAPVAVSGGNNVPVTLACPAAVASGCDGQVILALSGGDPAAKLVAARRERRTVIGKSGKFHIAAGHTTTVPVRLSRRGARILRTRGHSHKVLKLEATVVMKTAAGTTSTTTTITVRAARRRPTPHRKRR